MVCLVAFSFVIEGQCSTTCSFCRVLSELMCKCFLCQFYNLTCDCKVRMPLFCWGKGNFEQVLQSYGEKAYFNHKKAELHIQSLPLIDPIPNGRTVSFRIESQPLLKIPPHSSHPNPLGATGPTGLERLIFSPNEHNENTFLFILVL